MAEQKPFRVEVTIRAPSDRVWAALTDPVEIRRWHGWDAEALDAEIEFIYVDHATQLPPDRIELEDGSEGQCIEVVPVGEATIVRVSRPGSLRTTTADSIEEGWRSFFEQMRHYLERHPGEERRTIFLAGKAVAADVATALGEKLPGRPWFESMFQRGIVTEEYGEGLVVLSALEPLDSDRRDAVHITVTTHGLDDTRFDTVLDDWWSWWSTQVESPESTIA